MSAQTGISWTDSTFNAWIGCTKVSPACDHCYAERDMATRLKTVEWGAGKPRKRTSAANLKLPERWNREAFWECADCKHRGPSNSQGLSDPNGKPYPMCQNCLSASIAPARRRVFSASLSDWLDNEVPIEWLVDFLDLVRRTPNLDWLLLTKRIGNWQKRLEEVGRGRVEDQPVNWPLLRWVDDWLGGEAPTNIWIGSTVVNQAEADRDVPKLLAIPARIRFLSVEPMLGPIDLNQCLPSFHCDTCDADFGALSVHATDEPIGLHWVIAGGESGPRARPSHPDWYRSLRDQCVVAGVPFHFKQHGEWVWVHDVVPNENNIGLWIRRDGTRHDGTDPAQFSADGNDSLLERAGKKAAGRLLDGVEHNGFPS